MDLGLTGRGVVVAGGSKGIGLACARAFLDEGARVAIVSRARANLDAAVRALGAHGSVTAIVADLVSANDARRMARDAEQALGSVDVLVNCAGAARRYPPDELDARAWHDAMDAKFFSYVHAIDALLPGMASRGAGAIVSVIGMGGKVASPIHLPGGAANAALMLATTGLAAAYGPKGVRINAVNPGLTLTDRVSEGLAAEARMTGRSADDLLAAARARVPLRRLADADEVARVVVFLASAQASYVTGAVVPMDGGAAAVI